MKKTLIGLWLLQWLYYAWVGYHPGRWDYYYTRVEQAQEAHRERLEQSRPDLEKALAAARELPVLDGRLARTLYELAVVEWKLGDGDRAIAHFREARAGFIRFDGVQGLFVGITDARLGEVLLARSDLDGSLPYLLEAGIIFNRTVNPRAPIRLRATVNLAQVHNLQGHYRQAYEELKPILTEVTTNSAVGDQAYRAAVARLFDSLSRAASGPSP